MESPNTEKVIVTLVDKKLEELKKQAKEHGVSLATYCRVVLSKQAGLSEHE